MIRGLFTNRAVRNLLRPGIAPGHTVHAGTGFEGPLWQVAELYREEGRSVVILAGERYGMGSSRDWAAKGAALVGARAVLAAGFERIHRSNLVNMGILPLLLPPERHPSALRLAAEDLLKISAPGATLAPGAQIRVEIHRAGGAVEAFTCEAAVETAWEVEILRRGGMIPIMMARTLKPRL
jgi:aconitate hydratase